MSHFIKSLGLQLQTAFFTGVVVVVPIWVALTLLSWIITQTDGLLQLLPFAWQPEQWLGVRIPGLGLLLAVLVLMLVGAWARNVIGRAFLTLGEKILHRIPFIRSVYTGLKQALEVLFHSKQSFQQVVLVEYPKEGLWSVAFVTNNDVQSPEFSEPTLALFIPTTPNPTSGYVLLVAKSKVKFLSMTTEEALRYIISLGSVPHFPAVDPQHNQQA